MECDGRRLKAFGRRGLRFAPDPLVDPDDQTGAALYADNRLDRGHLARRADLVWGPDEEAQRANRESFYYTNIAPQHAGFNQSRAGGLWGALEDAIYEDAAVAALRLSVIAGPVLGARDPVYRGLAIPRAFWKIVAFIDAETGALEAKGYILTQDDLLDRIEALGLEAFRLYRVPLAEIEGRTGLGFGTLRQADARGEAARPRRAEGAPARGITEITTRADIAR